MKEFIEIKVKGIINPGWFNRFENLDLEFGSGYSIISGQIMDESQKHGILNMIRDFNLKLISLQTKEY